ncbi:alcohol oxidase [Suillus subalutaceus]|uniref:alcohol oxidase n=1 Tax=Suillus subalutaceus TaxID=48586 RepID=UPI001B885E7E|nr:alcohol oxidase [Suillus subalutaceus]KAG1847326.1 alcohol oxidase [Suillus subalutaceus]
MMVSAADFSQEDFDYIIIGGGTTGLALASILSTNASVRVGVIEAGLRKDDEMILVPGMIGKAVGNPKYDWNFITKPQPFAQNREIPISRGKVLGGSSALNYMAYLAPELEHNDWEKLGIKGWNWNAISDAIKSAEAWSPPTRHAKAHNADNVAKNHGRYGYVKTTAYSYYYDLVLPFFETMNQLGVVTNQSEASGDIIGIWTYTASIDPQTNTRSYSTNAYYDRVSNRPNIVVLTGAQASRVIFRQTSSSDLQATAVEYHKGGRTYKVPVRREVIISTGIGNPDLLRRLNIPIKIDLPGVGENFQDHPRVSMGAELKGLHETTDDLNSETFAQQSLEQYRHSRTGMLSSTLSTLVFIPLSSFIPLDKMQSILSTLDEALKLPQVQNSPWKKWYDVQRAWLENDGIAQLEVALFPSYTHAGCTNEKAKHYTISVFLQHAWSRGHVHATSSSVLDSPEIDPATLDSLGNIDMMMLLEAMKYAFKIMETGALGNLTAEIIDPKPSWSDEQLMDYIRSDVVSGFHPIGTASMLPRSANGVVDNELKVKVNLEYNCLRDELTDFLQVYGTTNLRVADASIFPIHLGTHPQATLYGLAHKAAEIIQTGEKARL